MVFLKTNLHYTLNNGYEFLALAATSKDAEWLRNILLEVPLWYKPIPITTIFCDSEASLSQGYGAIYNGKSKAYQFKT